ncbi:MAG: glycosyltransferase family 4 protein [Chloroflexi bacterium]|nr:glycosyltransferase family 4 protein [Chloroflexota bacterium]
MAKILLVANTDWYLVHFRSALAKFLVSEGFDVVMVSPAGPFVESLGETGPRWVRWEVGRRTMAPWTEIAAVIRLAQIYRHEQPDLVHHFTVKPVIYGSLAARLAGVPDLVNSITGLGYLFLQDNRLIRMLRSLVSLLYRYALQYHHGQVIFENQFDSHAFQQLKLVRPDQCHLIEGAGVDSNIYHPAPEPAGTPRVILPGRMLWDKGVGLFVEAARLLQPRLAARFELVGNLDPGNPAAIKEETIRQWEKEGLLAWCGFQEDMAQVYQQSHIVVLPSSGEGLPTALIEAAACGKPIVTTDVPGCRDVVADGVNGILVPPQDPAALTAAIERLVVDAQLRQSMGARGREIVMTRFTNEIVNRETLEVYQKALGQQHYKGE